MDATRNVVEGVKLWARSSVKAIRKEGLSGFSESTRLLYTHILRFYGLIHNYGEPIYDAEWDVLIVLDACRADLMEEVASEYDFINFDVTNSLGSCSPEWMEKNFTSSYIDEMQQTAYITGNPYSETCLESSEFELFDEVWRYAWDEELETIPPGPLTDRAITVAREGQPDRLIVHYMQPHHPFVPSPLGEGIRPDTGERIEFSDLEDVWTRLQRGDLSREEVWEGYRDNLEYVLESVETLINNIDGKVVITADHGNALGEFHMYGHPIYAPVWPLKRVPWCEYEATDSGTYTRDQTASERHDTTDDETLSTEDKLAALGYI
ncbi:hypothetical protein [Haloferax sp. ATB1]|uniref:hypothetical protein n=1 Tax=Haloferax sp. ATB1 TaxID=1508454 RepID=UPI000FE14145|nr:hypothetical protein [Haloferax sp. ATB1]